jgi:hypothetical protein
MAADSLRTSDKWAPRASSIGRLVIPDPRTWPQKMKDQFREVIRIAHGECDPLYVFIFQDDRGSFMLLQDAVTGAAILPVDESNWHTSEGFPILSISNADVDSCSERLCQAGYRVHVIVADEVMRRREPRKSSGRKRSGRRVKQRSNVVSISEARDLQRRLEDCR